MISFTGEVVAMMQYMVAGAGISAVLVEYFSDVSALENLEFEIEDIRIKEIKPNLILIVPLLFTNGSNKNITNLTASFDVYINPYDQQEYGELFVGWGETTKDISIPPQSSDRYNVEVSVKYVDLWKIREFIWKVLFEGEKFQMNIDGTVKANVFFGMFRGERAIHGYKDFGDYGEPPEEVEGGVYQGAEQGVLYA